MQSKQYIQSRQVFTGTEGNGQEEAIMHLQGERGFR